MIRDPLLRWRGSTRQLGRRRLVFWVGFGLFGLSQRFGANRLDALAAALMEASEPNDSQRELGGVAVDRDEPSQVGGLEESEHWTFEENDRWYWFQRQSFRNNQWQLSGRTQPIDKHSGQLAPDRAGYLADEAVPLNVRQPRPPAESAAEHAASSAPINSSSPEGEPPGPTDDAPLREPGQATAERRARHGRPPSRWLRSLNADELRIWLATIEVPEAGVSGMSFWEHLTRDHFFDPARLTGLSTEEQAKLHAAAHHGY